MTHTGRLEGKIDGKEVPYGALISEGHALAIGRHVIEMKYEQLRLHSACSWCGGYYHMISLIIMEWRRERKTSK
jgi:hypothetical protein